MARRIQLVSDWDGIVKNIGKAFLSGLVTISFSACGEVRSESEIQSQASEAGYANCIARLGVRNWSGGKRVHAFNSPLVSGRPASFREQFNLQNDKGEPVSVIIEGTFERPTRATLKSDIRFLNPLNGAWEAQDPSRDSVLGYISVNREGRFQSARWPGITFNSFLVFCQWTSAPIELAVER